MFGLKSSRYVTSAFSRSKLTVSLISSISLTTPISFASPLAWTRAKTWKASSQRSCGRISIEVQTFRLLRSNTNLSCKPTRRFWQEKQGDTQEDSRKHLQAPWHPEGSGTRNKRATKRDVKHYHNTPGLESHNVSQSIHKLQLTRSALTYITYNCPLLGAHKSTSFAWGCNLGDVDGNLC